MGSWGMGGGILGGGEGRGHPVGGGGGGGREPMTSILSKHYLFQKQVLWRLLLVLHRRRHL